MKSVEPLYHPVMQRWAADEADARRYLRQLVLSQPQRLGPDTFLDRLPLPLAEYGRHVRQERRETLARMHRVRDDAAKAAAQAMVERIAARDGEIQQALRDLTGEARIAYLAGLIPQDRDRVATQDERAAAVALRKTAIMAGAVRKRLGCTATELNRWHGDGRLPHLFIRKISIEKLTDCRFWSAEQVEEAVEAVTIWREQDAIRKRFARTGIQRANI